MQPMVHNHDWEIAYCQIRRGHDGVFLTGRDMDFHHNAIDDVQDDAFDPGGSVPGMTDGIYTLPKPLRLAFRQLLFNEIGLICVPFG